MRVRPGLLVLPLLLAVPVAATASSLVAGGAAATVTAKPAQPAPSAQAVDGLLAAAMAADSAVLHGAALTPATRGPAVAARRVEAPVVVSARRITAARPVAVTSTRTAAQAAPAQAAPAQSKPSPSAAPTAAAPKPAATSAPVRTGRDDYPYRTATTNSYDDWGFTKRQCVSFAAWRLAQAGRALDNRAEGWGSALDWDDVARQRGKAVSRTAVVGAVAHWNAGEGSAYYAPGSSTANGTFAAGGYGHVGWVTHVFADGSAQVEQYNSGGDRSWSTMRVKAPRYLRL